MGLLIHDRRQRGGVSTYGRRQKKHLFSLGINTFGTDRTNFPEMDWEAAGELTNKKSYQTRLCVTTSRWKRQRSRNLSDNWKREIRTRPERHRWQGEHCRGSSPHPKMLPCDGHSRKHPVPKVPLHPWESSTRRKGEATDGLTNL